VFDRFTLDEVSAKIWWPLAMVALVALVLTVPAANHAADRARRQSAARAILITNNQIQPLISTGASNDQMSTALAQIQRANPQFDAVRLWSTESKLLIASSVASDPLAGGTAGVNDTDIDGAKSTGSWMDVTDRLPTGDTGPVSVHTFVKVDGPAGGTEVSEFEANDAALLAQVHHDWNGYRIVGAAAFLLLLVLALLSMREPVADIGFGVPFYPATLPPNLAIVDAERAVVIEHEDDHVRQRVASLQQRLDESERQRLKAEAQLQQALTTLGTGGRNVPGLPPEPPTPTLPAGRRAKPVAAEPAVAAAASAAATPSVVPMTSAEPAAAASSGRKHAPKKRSSRRQKPATEPTPTPRRSRADEPAEAPAPPVTTPERVTISADEVAVTAQPAAASTAKAPDATETKPEVVVIPTEKPAPVGAPAAAASAPASTTAKAPAAPPVSAPTKTPPGPSSTPAATPAPAQADGITTEADAAPDLLDRVASESEQHPQPLDDPADLRARLARTAALKKPGSKERQDQREGLQHRTSEQ